MAGVGLSDANLGIQNYLSGVDMSLDSSALGRSLFTQNNNWTGEQLEWRVHVKRNGGLGAAEDGGAVRVADKQTYATAKAGRKMLTASVQLTDGVMASLSGSSHVAKDVVASELEGIMDDIMELEDGLLFRDGTGTVATAQTGTSGTTLVVDDARLLWDGVTYDVYSSGGTFRGTILVNSVAQATDNTTFYATATLNAALSGLVATDLIVWKDSRNLCPRGLAALITDTGTLQNISASTYPRHTSFVKSIGGDLSTQNMRRFQAALYAKSGNRKTDGLACISSPGIMSVFDELFEGEVRYTADSKVGGAAFGAFQSSFGQVKVIPHKHSTFGVLYFPDTKQIYRGNNQKLTWRKQGQTNALVASQTSLKSVGTLLEIYEFYIRQRISSGKMTGLTDPRLCAYA